MGQCSWHAQHLVLLAGCKLTAQLIRCDIDRLFTADNIIRRACRRQVQANHHAMPEERPAARHPVDCIQDDKT